MDTLLHSEGDLSLPQSISDDSKRVAAFFDLDHTVVQGNTGTLYLRDLYADGLITIGQLIQVSWVLLRYKFAMVDMASLLARAASMLQGTHESELQQRCQRLFDSKIQSKISQAAVEAVRAHQRLGHVVVLLTAQSSYIAEPVCEMLQIPHVLCTRLESKDGLLTGKLDGPACYGEGKCFWAKRFANEHGIDISRSYFYTDSYSDLPMLELVGEKRPVNPDPRLSLEATRRGWTVLRFEDK
jgi:HAD superfamily hydrolase (TIGR01490 family)